MVLNADKKLAVTVLVSDSIFGFVVRCRRICDTMLVDDRMRRLGWV